MSKYLYSTFLISLICIAGVYAQNAASPYSIFGIGKLSDYGLTYHKNMGGLGISNGNSYILNNVNPALLPLNFFSTFEAGLYAESRSLTTSDLTESNLNGGLSYITLGFPM